MSDATTIKLEVQARAEEMSEFNRQFQVVERTAEDVANSVKLLGAALSAATDLSDIRKLISGMLQLQEQVERNADAERKAAAENAKASAERQATLSRELEIRRRTQSEVAAMQERERRNVREINELAARALRAKQAAERSANRSAAEEMRRLANEARRAQQEVDAVDKAYSSFGSTVKQLAVALGVIAGLRLTSDFFKATIVDGVRFNATLETASISIASVLRQFNPEQFTDFNSALERSNGLITQLRQAALDSPATFDEMLTGFTGFAGAMSQANIPLDEQVGLTLRLTQAMAALGIESRELRQEGTALLLGNINQNARLATTLGITREQILAEKERGTLLEFLTQKLAAFGEAADAAQKSTSLLESRLGEATTASAAEATVELSNAYKQLLVSLTDLVTSPAFKDFLKFIASTGTSVVKAVSGAADTARMYLNESPGQSGRNYLSTADTLAGRLSTASTPAELASVRSSTAFSLRAFTAEKNVRLDPTSRMVPFTEKDVTLIETRFQSILTAIEKGGEELVAQNAELAAQEAENLKIAEAEKAKRLEREKAVAWLQTEGVKIRESLEESRRAQLTDEERVQVLDQMIEKKRQEGALAWFNAQSIEAAQAADLKTAGEVQPLIEERLAAEKRITEEKKKQADLSKRDLEKETERLDKQRAAALQRRSDVQQRGQNAGLAAINSNRFMTERQKEAARFQIFSDEQGNLPGQISAANASAGAAPDGSATRQFYTNESNRLQDRQAFGVGADLEANRPLTMIEDVQAKLVELQDNFLTIGDVVSNTLQGAIDGISGSLTGLLTRTMTWGDALRNIGGSVLNSVIGAITRMFAEWIVGRLAVSAVEKTAGAADAAAKAPGAIMTSISSFGVAAAVGLAAVIAALAAFDVGGFTGSGGDKEIAGIAHKNEWVAPAWMNRNPASAALIHSLEAMRQSGNVNDLRLPDTMMSMAQAGSFGGGGGAGSSSSPIAGSPVTNVAFFNTRQDAEDWIRSQEGRSTMIDFNRRYAES